MALPYSAGIGALGLGDVSGLGDMLGQQVAGETEDERKKRLAALAQQRAGLPSASAAIGALFGGGAKAGGMTGGF